MRREYASVCAGGGSARWLFGKSITIHISLKVLSFITLSRLLSKFINTVRERSKTQKKRAFIPAITIWERQILRLTAEEWRNKFWYKFKKFNEVIIVWRAPPKYDLIELLNEMSEEMGWFRPIVTVVSGEHECNQVKVFTSKSCRVKTSLLCSLPTATPLASLSAQSLPK